MTETEVVQSIIEEFLQKMGLVDFTVIGANITLQDPQVLIGGQGQTLADLGRLINIIATKKLKKNVHISLDINNYKSKKTEHLKKLALDLADEVAFTKEKKILQPMSSYERMVIHAELAARSDIKTESFGEGVERHVVISPRL